MSVESWLLFCITETVLCFSPGPAVLLVVSLSLARGAPDGFKAALGILSANAMYFAISATSLGALLLASYEVFTIIKWAGAAYLIWCGAKMLFTKARGAAGSEQPKVRPRARLASFPYGFLTQGANPKALVFFAAILPQFINPAASVGAQLFLLGVSSILIEVTVLGIYVAACHRARGLAASPRFAAPLERLGGLLLIGAGARLAVTSRV